MSGQKTFLIALGVIGAAGVVFIVSRVMGGGAPSFPANVLVADADTTGFRGYIVGDPNAPVEITEYADFQCPACAAFELVQYPGVKARVIDTGKARFRYRDFPLDDKHPQARLAAHTAACANDQGKFEDIKPMIYRRQNDWGGFTGRGYPSNSTAYEVLGEVAASVGLDMTVWRECMSSAKYAGRIQASQMEAGAVGAGSTPTFLIGGRLYEGMNADRMIRIVDSLVAAVTPVP